ncbi:hypothetical protein BJ508DRAFT_313816 [Ascobolus immersus RN42]|uniref:Uncharacterized protein n=1 Tax=Ascobolus immersus RN42 TaxID=1160509 RepID=A0A3N4HHC6_ASCIM|nr:hypothetical protein BJ508DRAFT_313816 [Ascobolus immersus RN42]
MSLREILSSIAADIVPAMIVQGGCSITGMPLRKEDVAACFESHHGIKELDGSVLFVVDFGVDLDLFFPKEVCKGGGMYEGEWLNGDVKRRYSSGEELDRSTFQFKLYCWSCPPYDGGGSNDFFMHIYMSLFTWSMSTQAPEHRMKKYGLMGMTAATHANSASESKCDHRREAIQFESHGYS